MPDNFYGMIKGLVKSTFKSASDHDIALHGAAIAFYTIFSAAPLVIITLAIINFFLGDQETTRVFTLYLSQLVGDDIATSLIELSEASRRNASGFIPSLVATGLLLFGATTVISQLKYSLNQIWSITTPKINSIFQYVINRVVSLIIIILLTVLFLASLLLEGGLTFFSSMFETFLPGIFSPIWSLASSLLSIFMTVLFFTLIFKILPDIHARWKDIFIGACVTSVLFLIGKYVVGFYLTNTSMQASYKAAGSLVIFLIWIYYNTQIVLLGAEFTQIYTKQYGKNFRPSWNAEIVAPD